MALQDSVLSIKDKTSFADNHASFNGGAIWIFNPIELKIINSTFTANVAEFGSGGAVSVTGGNSQTRKYVGCSFKRNQAVDGGALHFYAGVGADEIVDSIFSENFAGTPD